MQARRRMGGRPAGFMKFRRINILLASLALSLASVTAAWADAAPPLATVHAIRSLSDAQALQGVPVSFTATVTYFRNYRKNLFVQDGSEGLFVKASTRLHLAPGDRVHIQGKTILGYRPSVSSSDITLVGHVAVPPAPQATFPELIRGQFDSTLVSVQGVVQAANLDAPAADHPVGSTLRLRTKEGVVHVQVDDGARDALDRLLDAEVEVTGVAGGKFDGKTRVTGVILHVPTLADVKVLHAARVNRWSLPLTPMDQILDGYNVNDRTVRVRVQGTVTYSDPGVAFVLQNGSDTLWVDTVSYRPLHIGDQVEVTGFPTVSNGFAVLSMGEPRDTGKVAPVAPIPLTWSQLASSRYLFNLVSITGQLVMSAREARQDEYVFKANGAVFSAVYVHPSPAGALPPMKQIPVGAQVRITGICVMDQSNPFGHDVPFDLLLRSPGDLTVIAGPSWLTVGHLGMLLGLLALVIFVIGMRLWFMERRMHRQVSELAYMEQRRGYILEGINSAQPLAQTIEDITELVAFKLNSTFCWCEVVDGATLGKQPANPAGTGLRIVEHPIRTRSGAALGKLYAAFDTQTAPDLTEQRTLTLAAELATLAIESKQLHSDLVHRSEFDLLTDVYNRFALERQMHEALQQARQTARLLGLIYIDLDRFKEVNDQYGHQIGDQYLQMVVQRMKTQLRPSDVIARLGGDEFAVLVTSLRGRAEIEEIAQRLRRCFSEPFALNGCAITGSASIGTALYPNDAASIDGLMSTADKAMYSSKNNGRGASDEA